MKSLNRRMTMIKRLMLMLVGLSFMAAAQAAHSVTLNWADTTNPAGTVYNVYRATGACSGSPVFSRISTAVTLKTYLDSAVVSGTYCYQVTASSGGVESSPSNNAVGVVPTFAPTSLTITVQ